MSRACYYMTVAEKDAYLAADPARSLVSGPHDTQADCTNVCQDATGTGTSVPGEILPGDTCCEGVLLPQNATATIVPANCPSASFIAKWDETNSRYEISVTIGSCINAIIYVVCQEGNWYLAGAVNAAATSYSCDPLSISFSVRSLCGCGPASITITE